MSDFCLVKVLKKYFIEIRDVSAIMAIIFNFTNKLYNCIHCLYVMCKFEFPDLTLIIRITIRELK